MKVIMWLAGEGGKTRRNGQREGRERSRQRFKMKETKDGFKGEETKKRKEK